MTGANDVITHAVLSWDGMAVAPHRFGGTEFRIGKREVGHIHGDSLVDIPFPKKIYWPFEDRPYHLRTPLLFAYSPSILPRPSDWNEDIHVTGYFFLDEEAYQPPSILSDFLAAGDAPICISFGSMVNRKAKRIDQIVRDALKQTNNRGIILSG